MDLHLHRVHFLVVVCVRIAAFVVGDGGSLDGLSVTRVLFAVSVPTSVSSSSSRGSVVQATDSGGTSCRAGRANAPPDLDVMGRE